MNILKPAKHVLIKHACSSDFGQYSIRLFTDRQTETVDEVSGLDLSFNNLNVNWRSCNQYNHHWTERSELRAEFRAFHSEIKWNFLEEEDVSFLKKKMSVKFSPLLWQFVEHSKKEAVKELVIVTWSWPSGSCCILNGIALWFVYWLVAIHTV